MKIATLTSRSQMSHSLLLTYSQSNLLSIDELVEFFYTKFDMYDLEVTVAKEHHRDGGVHYHVLLKTDRRIRYRNMNRFDVGGYHPNILRIDGDLQYVEGYVKKENNWIWFTNNKECGCRILNCIGESVALSDLCNIN